jgi:H+/Cl- antiporter ClcA
MLFSTALNISPHDLLFTAIMGVIGAVISFFVSYILRKLFSDSDDFKKKSKNA